MTAGTVSSRLLSGKERDLSTQIVSQDLDARLSDDVEMIARNLTGLYLASHQLAPTIFRIVIGGQVSREVKIYVAGINLRLVILNRGKIYLLNIPQYRRQRLSELLINLIGATIDLVLCLGRRVAQLRK